MNEEIKRAIEKMKFTYQDKNTKFNEFEDNDIIGPDFAIMKEEAKAIGLNLDYAFELMEEENNGKELSLDEWITLFQVNEIILKATVISYKDKYYDMLSPYKTKGTHR